MTQLTQRFQIVRNLGVHKNQKVFLADDSLMERGFVVVRVFRRGLFNSYRENLCRFFSWNQGVSHPHLGKILDVGVTDANEVFCVREYIQASQELFQVDPTQWIKHLFATVQFLHENSRIHGALKPSNLFIQDGLLKITDPRIFPHKDHSIEDIRYTAPEVLAEGPSTVASDLYSVGGLLYRGFSGRDPFDDLEINNLRAKYMWGSPKPLTDICHVPKLISDLVGQLLNRNVDVRIAAFRHGLSALEVPPIGAARAAYVGRDSELRTIDLAIEKPSRKGLTVFLVDGEPGIGKTRFVEETRLRANLSGTNFEIISCEKGMDFKTVLRAVGGLLKRRVLKKRSNANNELGNFAATLSDLLINDDEKKHAIQFPLERTISDLVGFIARLSEHERTIIAIENVAHADDTTKQLIERMCFRAAEIPLCLILTTTIPSSGCLSNVAKDCLGDSLVHIHLTHLSLEMAQGLVSFFGCGAERATQILRWSGGQPLLIEEYAKMTSGESPRNIDTFITRLLANVSKESLRTAQIISLFEEPVAPEVIAQMSRDKNVHVHLEILLAAGISDRQQNTVFIKYGCVRTALSSRLSPQRQVKLSALGYALLTARGAHLETLAALAFRAQLFDAAWKLFQKLAGDAHEAGDVFRAVEFFRRMEKCAKKTRRAMPNLDRFKFARCYDRIGKQAHARKIYERLLADQTVHADPVLISSICGEISGPYQTYRKWDRVQLCTHAISLLPKESPELVQLHVRLTNALIRKGDLNSATEALTEAENINRSCGALQDLRPTWAHLFLRQGDFKNALKYMESVGPPGNRSPKLLNNIAFCLEKLGNLRLAKETQTIALNLATTTGYAAIRIISLQNLAGIEVKLGNFVEAGRLYTLAFQTLDQLSARGKEFSAQVSSLIFADAAQRSIHISDYKAASQFLRRIPPDPDSRYESDNVWIHLVQCELALALGNIEKVKSRLRAIRQSSIAKIDFFRIEQAIVESCLPHLSTHQKIVLLKEAVEMSEKHGTLHQNCRAMNELSNVLIQSGRTSEAQQLIIRTLEIADANRYRPLLPRIFLLRGLAASTNEEKSADLFKAFYMASEIGLLSLAAEIAFWIGTFQLEFGNFTAAQEYLGRSVSLVDSIATRLPVAWRKEYVAGTFRHKAKCHLENLAKNTPSASANEHQKENTEMGRAFKAIYRLAVATDLAKDIESVLDLLLHAFESFLSQPAILMLETPKGAIWRSVRMKLTDEFARRVRALGQKSGDQIHFGSGNTTPPKDTLAWIPLAAGEYRGGIYVTCLPGESPFSEQEMEFLTVVGVIANRSLDKLCARRTEPVQTPRIQELHGIIGASKAIREVYSHIEIAAGNTATVLIDGESGTGKELVAKAIHRASARAKGPFVPVDCGAIPDTLIEAELFGAKRGAYTDAVADRPGLFEMADRGTIFLDEIANTTPAVQAKLLRVLQEREIRRIGEAKARSVDVRLIAATNGDLDALSKDGRFRKDLLYRLKVLHITVPPLRQRREDIPMLAHAFLERLNFANRTKKTFEPGVTAELLTHSFPGNVRELQNAVERAFFLAKGATISRIALEMEGSPTLSNEVQSWFKEIVDGRKNFWSHVHDRYKKRDIPREKVIALVDFGLKSTRGSYKNMASMFNLKGPEYRRFMDFLRRNKCLLDFRPYRQAAAGLS